MATNSSSVRKISFPFVRIGDARIRPSIELRAKISGSVEARRTMVSPVSLTK